MRESHEFGEPFPCVVLSPHLDDAVFSAWHVLARGANVLVATVFAGVPGRGFVTSLDRAHGAVESAAWMERRRLEDREALGITGCRVVHLSLMDVQYRSRDIPKLYGVVERNPANFLSVLAAEPRLRTSPRAVLTEVGPWLGRTTTVYAPVGIGGHPDHRDVGRAALALVDRVQEVRFYADSPYYLARGMPAVVTGSPKGAADRVVNDGVAALRDGVLRAHHVELTDDEWRDKQRGMVAYATEFAAVDADFGGLPSDGESLRHEVWWSGP